ncbi:LacI family transcriptional regulator [Paracoccus sp. JM45]|nr:LacI family transcriptional regulator [Paracoccus sp. JM45]
MKELSVAIGISRPTLARYFEDPSSVRPTTAAKIQVALSKVDYVYNFLATRQNRKSTGIIGVIIPHYKDLFFASLLDTIEDTARDAGFTIITQSSQGDPAIEAQAVGKLRSMTVDGAIITALGFASDIAAFSAASQDFPLVFADSRPSTEIAGADFVGTDNDQSIGAIVQYLCRTGKPPVFLGMPRLNSNAQEREVAYRSYAHKLGFEPHLIKGDDSAASWRFEEYSFNLLDRYFSLGRYTDVTILCANDRLAIGAMRAANKHGLFANHLGQAGGFRIAGHDDYSMAEYVNPTLTTVAQNVDLIGQQAVRLLVDRIRGGRQAGPVNMRLEGALKIRNSTRA